MAYNNRYQYETSPRKLEPEYRPIKKKYPKKSTAKKINKETKKQYKKQTKKKRELKSQVKIVGYVIIGFSILFAISYRNSLINENFAQIKTLKTNLAAIEKENEQLQVNIENNLNLKTVEQAAGEQLGMQKLNNSQKVYVNLPKQDYVQPATEEIKKEENVNWLSKLIRIFIGK